MGNNPVITVVTDIVSPPEEVWRVLTDFAGYAQWHPALRFVDVPTEILPGTLLRAQVSTGTENNGEYSFTVLHYEAPRRLIWEGGIPDVLTGQHSFLLDSHDGGTRFTESEEFTGTAAVETVEAARSQIEENYTSYGRALKERLLAIYFEHLISLARPAGSPDRSALPIAGDDDAAKKSVTALLDRLGYGTVDAGTTTESWRIQEGSPAYVFPYLSDPRLPWPRDPGKPADTKEVRMALEQARKRF